MKQDVKYHFIADLTLTLDLLTLVSGHTWRVVVNPSTKFEDPTAIRS